MFSSSELCVTCKFSKYAFCVSLQVILKSDRWYKTQARVMPVSAKPMPLKGTPGIQPQANAVTTQPPGGWGGSHSRPHLTVNLRSPEWVVAWPTGQQDWHEVMSWLSLGMFCLGNYESWPHWHLAHLEPYIDRIGGELFICFTESKTHFLGIPLIACAGAARQNRKWG